MQLCLRNTRHIIITTQGAHFVGRSCSHRANDLHLVLDTWGRGVEETKQGQIPLPSYQGMLWAHVEITHHSLESLNDWSALQPFYRLFIHFIVAGVLQSGTVVPETSVTTIDVQSVKQFWTKLYGIYCKPQAKHSKLLVWYFAVFALQFWRIV